ncbi:MAG: hypothetical protein RMZ95_001980 [Nostoc sp. DedQUE07]
MIAQFGVPQVAKPTLPRAIHPDNRPLFVVGLINSELSSECIGAIPIATEPTVLPSQWQSIKVIAEAEGASKLVTESESLLFYISKFSQTFVVGWKASSVSDFQFKKHPIPAGCFANVGVQCLKPLEM